MQHLLILVFFFKDDREEQSASFANSGCFSLSEAEVTESGAAWVFWVGCVSCPC